jgi:hypothetical protein
LAHGVPEVKKWRGGSSQQSKNVRRGIVKQQASFAVLVRALSCVKFEFFFLKLLENKAARPPTLLRDLATLTMGVAKFLRGVGSVASLFSSCM